MSMTHYMELLAQNQPWNLILFMEIPILLAETVVSELYVLYTRNLHGTVRQINRWAGIFVGFYFLIAAGYVLIHAVLPLTVSGGWRGWIDHTAVWFYLSGVIPLFAIALLEIGVLLRGASGERKLMVHAALVGLCSWFSVTSPWCSACSTRRWPATSLRPENTATVTRCDRPRPDPKNRCVEPGDDPDGPDVLKRQPNPNPQASGR